MSDDPRKTPQSIASNPKVQAIGMAWYDRADYPEILRVMADADRLPRTYDDWLQRSGQGEQELIAQGVRVFRAVIKPQPFIGWCALRGLKLDAKARMAFATEHAARETGLQR